MPQAGESCVIRSLKSTMGVGQLPTRLRWHWPSMSPNVALARHRIDQRIHGPCTTPRTSRDKVIPSLLVAVRERIMTTREATEYRRGSNVSGETDPQNTDD